MIDRRMEVTQLIETSFKDRQNAFEVFYFLKKRIEEKTPTSLIRLGDGEGTILGYPDFVERKRVNNFFKTWYGKTDFSEEEALLHHRLLKQAITTADIVGLPRVKQLNKSPNWAVVEKSLIEYDLISPRHVITDAAIHRYLTFALQYRGLLKNLPFLGIISCRDLSVVLSDIFNIEEVVHYSIQGESNFPGSEQQPHFPERFNELQEKLSVPMRGAVFLVGAGVLGKVYCKWIKNRGGIAIDIGSICDAWANIPSRTKHPIHKLERYAECPEIGVKDAITRFNNFLDERGLDGNKISFDELASDFPKSW